MVDKKEEVKKRFDWLPVEMPVVTRLVREKRALFGNDHVNECWKRGVLMREPGWFFAREGSLAVGTPWDTPDMANFAALHVTSTQGLLVMREPGGAHGTD